MFQKHKARGAEIWVVRAGTSWADTGVTPYPAGERTGQGAETLFKSEIARWSEVVRENQIQPVD